MFSYVLPDSLDMNVENEPPLKRAKMSQMEMKGRIKYPAELPPLTVYLGRMVEEGKLLDNQPLFIKFWGQFLHQKTGGQPSKQDYSNFAATIVETYDKLRGGNNGNVGLYFLDTLTNNFVTF